MRFNILLLILAAALSYLMCKNLQKSQDQSKDAVPQAEPQAEYPWNASRVGESNDDNAPTKQFKAPPRMVQVNVDAIPPATTSRKSFLSTGWWHLSMAYQASDTTVYQNYQPKWLKFREDLTFDVLIDAKVVDTGRWNFDETKKEIYLSCKDPYLNNTWVVRDNGFLMIWKGNTNLNVTGIQIRVLGSKTPPPTN